MTEDLLGQVAQKIASAQSILLTCHRGPDGDSVGSLVALAALLKEHGKKVTLYNPDLVPRNLKWLPHTRGFVQQLKKKARFDLTIVVDCADQKLLGDKFPDKEVTGEVIALDHHGSGRPFGDLFVSDPSMAAVGVMVAVLADRIGWPISKDAGYGIYVSIVSDTGGFRHPSTDGQVLQLAARLVADVGVEPSLVSDSMAQDSSRGRHRLLARALTELRLAVNGKLGIIVISAEMVKECRANWEDTEGLINYARSLRGVECGVLISPSKYGGIRVSMRARGPVIDAGKLCFELGGGGHPGAAGCTLEGTLDEACKTIIATVQKAVDAAGN